MPIQANIPFQDMVLALILVRFFYFQIMIGVKILLFVVYTIVHLCILIIKKDKLVIGEGATQRLDDTLILHGQKESFD